MGDLQDWSPELENDQNHLAIEVNSWEVAEKATQEILTRVQPTVVSEKRRNDVIEYVQRLIKDCLGCEVFQFGSVPLKTYLPDGDIDLTVFGALNLEDALADDVCSVLERGEQNTDTKFVVKDVQLIPAEVKLVKCIVQNIVVDISFNQLGGLCTLCFLEQVDRLIGKSNLFKRSIILIKAWCYYESRILGAHHGLISTYALETLVLYIFRLFHSSLNGPVAVLHKFLDYYSKFDWDNYCISLNGPISISSLPELVVGASENYVGDLLFSDAFLKDCMEMFADPSRVSEMSRSFPPKHFNIVDPLRESNNLGRSVSKGNFYRIQSALNFGARKLGRILSLPEESLANEIHNFFSNTLDRHENDLRPDVQDPSPSLHIKTYQEDSISSDLGSSDFLEDSYCNGVNNYQILSEEMELSSPKLLEMENQMNMKAISGFGLSKDENDLIAPIIQDLKISDEIYKPGYACSCVTYGEASCEEQQTILDNHNNGTVVSRTDLLNPTSFDALMVDVDPDYKKNPEALDFSGEFVNHLNSLQYGRWWYNYSLNASIQYSPRLSPSMLSHSANSYFPQPAFYVPTNLAMIPRTNFGSEDKPKIRGTGTYFPNTNHYRDTPSSPRAKNPVQVRSPRYNGHTMISPRRKLSFKTNGSILPPERRAEFAPFVDPPTETTSLQSNRQSMNEHSFVQNPNLSLPILVPHARRQTPVLDANQETEGKKSYRLKDADDFPPLSI